MSVRWLLLVPIAVALTACGKHEADRAAAASLAPPSGEQRLPDGSVVIPTDSPKLKEIRVEQIQEAEAPVGEVVSPGKVETNPNRVSHVTLPLAGRISAALVKIGDAVRRGEAVLTIESPDADAAESTWRQAQAALTQARANLKRARPTTIARRICSSTTPSLKKMS